MKVRDIPNLISVFRILLVLPIVYFMLVHEYVMALLLFAVAGASDALDGFLARRYNWVTRLGGILDPLADKLLQVSAYVTLAAQSLIPAWLVAIIVLRDVVIVVGGMIYHYRFERFKAAPSLISKLNTLLQIVLVIVVVFDAAFNTLHTLITEVLIYSVLFTTVLSGLDYVVHWGRRARDIHREKKG